MYLAFASVNTNAQSIKVPAASPMQTITQAFGLGEIKIEYSRPGIKNRVIFGDLVPYGKIWRTGANQATKISFTEDVKINGSPVSAGTYALYTVPEKSEWDILLYKDLELGGNVSEYKPEKELMRFKVKTASLNEKKETFTIGISDVTPASCNIDLMWDKTKVSFPVSAEVDSRVMKQIEKELAPGDRRPYYAAANYYYETDKDLNQALEWASKASESNPDAFWMHHLKAKIQVKLKDYPGAIKSAEASIAAAQKQKNDEFVKLNEKLIADAKKNTGAKQ